MTDVKNYKVVDEGTGKEVALPVVRMNFRDNIETIDAISAPPVGEDTGTIVTNAGRYCYPGAFGLKIVPR